MNCNKEYALLITMISFLNTQLSCHISQSVSVFHFVIKSYCISSKEKLRNIFPIKQKLNFQIKQFVLMFNKKENCVGF